MIEKRSHSPIPLPIYEGSTPVRTRKATALLLRSRRRSASGQDETRLRLKMQTGRVITARGVKPIVSVEWPREAFWLYGVVEPLTGWHFCHEYPHLDGENFQKFLDALSQELRDYMALIQMDQASTHQALALSWPENLIPIFQPVHSPQLNPIERLWQFIKHQFKGENFSNL
ncbi:IS630 family transposase [Nostoc sp.]|uniref:IS630 family transposase n=1 Tax=Nostoc sp. TaxID=1180 RepID=UPI002FF64BF4